jgi:hypothetical protein
VEDVRRRLFGAPRGASGSIGAWNKIQGSREAKIQRDKINGNTGWVDRAELREGERDAGFIVAQSGVRAAIPDPG